MSQPTGSGSSVPAPGSDEGTRADLRVLSYGGGTQSAALALMSATGQLPELDAVIFADTGGELPATYAYAEYVKRHLAAVGIPFLTVQAGNLEADLRVVGRNICVYRDGRLVHDPHPQGGGLLTHETCWFLERVRNYVTAKFDYAEAAA